MQAQLHDSGADIFSAGDPPGFSFSHLRIGSPSGPSNSGVAHPSEPSPTPYSAAGSNSGRRPHPAQDPPEGPSGPHHPVFAAAMLVDAATSPGPGAGQMVVHGTPHRDSPRPPRADPQEQAILDRLRAQLDCLAEGGSVPSTPRSLAVDRRTMFLLAIDKLEVHTSSYCVFWLRETFCHEEISYAVFADFP